MVNTLSADISINWDHIRENEKTGTNWSTIAQHWKPVLIQKLCTPGRFKVGGDRKSAAVRGAKQLAVVAYAETLALQRPLAEDDTTRLTTKFFVYMDLLCQYMICTTKNPTSMPFA